MAWLRAVAGFQVFRGGRFLVFGDRRDWNGRVFHSIEKRSRKVKTYAERALSFWPKPPPPWLSQCSFFGSP